MTLALETLAVANARRREAVFEAVRVGMLQLNATMRKVGKAIMQAARSVVQFLLTMRPGYYWRDGKLRRDHSYFRARARRRRALLRAERTAR